LALIDRAMLIDVGASVAGTAAAGLVTALLLALLLAPAFVLAAAARALREHGSLGGLRWRPIVGGLLVAVLLTLAIEFAGDEPSHWGVRGGVLVALVGLVLALLAAPIAWWRRRGPRSPTPRQNTKPPISRSRHAVVRLAAAAVLLASTVPAALLKQRVYPEPLAWSAGEAVGLAVVGAPFAWLLGRVWFGRRRGSGTLAWAATIALGGWLSLAARPLLIRQTTAAMQELASMVGELHAGTYVKPRSPDRWRYGQCAPLVQGMSVFYRELQSSLDTMDALEPVLNDSAFRDARALASTEARLAALRRRIAEIDQDLEQSTLELRATIREGRLSPLMRDRILEGVTDGLVGTPRLGQSTAQFVAALERLVAFMRARHGTYSYDGADILFDSDRDAERYNSLVAELESQQSRATAAGEAQQRGQRQRADEFGRWAQDPFTSPRPPRRE
jgi:hypothetical protein